MTWLLATILICLVIEIGLTVVLLLVLWSHLESWESVRSSLRVWDQPEHLVTPLATPGTSWAHSDEELAYQEQQLMEASARRMPPARDRRGFLRSRGP